MESIGHQGWGMAEAWSLLLTVGWGVSEVHVRSLLFTKVVYEEVCLRYGVYCSRRYCRRRGVCLRHGVYQSPRYGRRGVCEQ